MCNRHLWNAAERRTKAKIYALFSLTVTGTEATEGLRGATAATTRSGRQGGSYGSERCDMRSTTTQEEEPR